MTSRQKRIIGVLVIINGVTILTLALFVTRFSGSTSSTLLPTPVPTYPPGSLSSQECQQRATEMMSRSGLSGTAALAPGESLRLDLVYRGAATETLDDAAQQVWKALDVAASLTADGCAIVSRIEILIKVRSPRDQQLARIRAAVDMTSLRAFHSGNLSESEFIDQVAYEVTPASDR